MSFLGKLFGRDTKKSAQPKPSGNRKVHLPTHGVKKSDSNRANKFGPKKD
jgi:hypothetical protein